MLIIKKYEDLFEDKNENYNHIEKNIFLSWKSKDIIDLNFSIIKNGIYNLKKMNPEWKLTINDDNEVDAYIKKYIPIEDYNLIKDRHIVEKTDLWRLLKIYNEGGMYMDIDRLYNISLTDLIGKHRTNIRCILPTYKNFDFAQDIMISASKNKIFKKAIEINLEKRRKGEKNICEMGPGAFIMAVSEVLTGKTFYRGRSGGHLVKLRKEIKETNFLDTYVENPPFNTLTYRGKPVLFDKNALYKHCSVIPHGQSS